MGLIAFFDGNDGGGNLVQAVEDNPGQSIPPKQNDSIRSLKMYNVRPGAEIRLFDAANGATSDDFCIVNVKRVVPEYVIGSLERSYEDEYVRVTFIALDGLDGKVSRITVS
jgi:hypothetical protein